MAEPGLIISHLFEQPGIKATRLTEKARIWSIRSGQEPAWLAGKPRRRILHWNLGLVLKDFKAQFLAQGLPKYLEENQIELFSFDLGPSARHHQGPLPLARPLGQADIMRHSEATLKFIRQYYQGPLAAENYNYYPTGLYQHITDPAFIRRYLDEFGLGLTLDLAHGAVTAWNLGSDPEEYFAALPLTKVREIHVSRPWQPGSRGLWPVDSHQAPGAREWQWLENILKNTDLPIDCPVFIEYYKDLGKLEAGQIRLATLAQAKGDV